MEKDAFHLQAGDWIVLQVGKFLWFSKEIIFFSPAGAR